MIAKPIKLREIMASYLALLSRHFGERESQNLLWELLTHFLGIDRLRLALEPEIVVHPVEQGQLSLAVQQLLAGRPIQYITGIAWFDGLPFIVNEHVLIPRQETEGLLQLASYWGANRSAMRVWDVCTGSGCIAISLKIRHPDWELFASDVSESALQLATQNAARLGVSIKFVHEDLLSRNHKSIMPYDLIISNPPYVPLQERSTLSAQVLAEPAEALFVPDDNPLVFYHALADLALSHLNQGGLLAVECHSNYAEEVGVLFANKGLVQVKVQTDHHGRNRFVTAKKYPSQGAAK